jgi:hypothetical protein
MKKRYYLFLLLPLFISHLSFSALPRESDFDTDITTVYKTLPPSLPTHKKLEKISLFFIGRPYKFGPLGEGEKGQYNQNPLYRTDGFDCLTYVETVLALTYASNLEEFKPTINKLRYKTNQPKFTERNHFMSADWNNANNRKGLVKDITLEIKDTNSEPVALLARTIIDKPSWYKHFKASDLALNDPSQNKTHLILLHSEAKKMKEEPAATPYIPLTVLLNKKGEANGYLFSQIPNGSIIEIVRPNWSLKDKIGTNLNVSHLGFAFRENNQLMFRHASTTEKKVITLPLEKYLARFLSSPTVKGINIQKIILE